MGVLPSALIRIPILPLFRSNPCPIEKRSRLENVDRHNAKVLANKDRGKGVTSKTNYDLFDLDD